MYHIHARIGTTQASQCPEPLNPVFQEERLCMERIWTKIIQSRFKQDGPDSVITFVPEYGYFLSFITAIFAETGTDLVIGRSHITPSEARRRTGKWRTMKECVCKDCSKALLRAWLKLDQGKGETRDDLGAESRWDIATYNLMGSHSTCLPLQFIDHLQYRLPQIRSHVSN